MEELNSGLQNQSAEPVQQEEDNTDKLSLRESIERAVADVKENKEVEQRHEAPTKQEVKQAVEADIEPPSEFSAEAKKAWREKDFRGVQKEYERLTRSRLQELSRVQTESKKAQEEAKTWKELGERAKPYIEARGRQGDTPEKALMEALALVDELRKGDPATLVEQLKAIGVDLSKATGQSTASVPKELQETILGVQKTVEQLKQEAEAKKTHELAGHFDRAFQALLAEKNRTGETVFPDLNDNSRKGIMFASMLGSLTRDTEFQQRVLQNYPDADLKVLVREAYKELGGRVLGESVRVSKENNQQIEKARRATASSPSRTVARSDSSSLAGKLSHKAAIQRALADYQEH